ncbi:MAG: ACP S-malonyltransferase [Planctomycetes bacterium]|nr:ACP S-malonyltransferase [Planctomycetota bacterium]MBL7037457.1 ACP S-malonyltransferase [Pirellulaceae bacterium]
MPKIMADHNAEGHLDALLNIWTSSAWNEVWRDASCDVESFQRLGIRHDTRDDELWRLCQQEGIILITGNRNAEGDDSLEVTIVNHRDEDSLPVLTIGDPTRLLKDRAYAARVAEQILEYVLDLENLRGVGRLYVP